MGIALHDLERGAKVAEIFDAEGNALVQRRLGVITKINFGGMDDDGKVHINPKAVQGNIYSIEVEFGDGKPHVYRGTSQLCLHQKADMAAMEKLGEQAQNRVAIDARRPPKMADALGLAHGQKIAPNDPDMGLRRK